MTRRRLANRRPAVTGHNNNSREETHWRGLSLSELADQILQIQRTAAHRHLSVQEWRMLDRMRRRRAALQKELTTASVANDRRLLHRVHERAPDQIEAVMRETHPEICPQDE